MIVKGLSNKKGKKRTSFHFRCVDLGPFRLMQEILEAASFLFHVMIVKGLSNKKGKKKELSVLWVRTLHFHGILILDFFSLL